MAMYYSFVTSQYWPLVESMFLGWADSLPLTVIIYRELFVKNLYILKSYIQFISVSLVQWLKRSPETREVVSSSLNSDLLFFLAIFLHVLMFNYFNLGK